MVEVVVAVAIIAITFAGFYLNLSQGFATMDESRENLRATQILGQQMEIIRLYTWSEINSNGFIPASFTAPFNPLATQSTNGPVYTARITITNTAMTESYASNHVLVTVTLNWTSANNISHTRQMSTIVSQYGLHNYYY